MKTLTREQSKQINAMTISNGLKKIVRSIVRYINNENERLKNHPLIQKDLYYEIQFLPEAVLIADYTGGLCFDIYFPGKVFEEDRKLSYDVNVSSKDVHKNNRQFINKIADLIYF